MGAHTDYTIALDTCVVVGAVNTTDKHHAAAVELIEYAHANGIPLVTSSTGVTYDQETNTDAARRTRVFDKVATIGNKAGGPFTLGMSRLDSGDVLISDEDKALLEQVRAKAWPTEIDRPRERRKRIDLHHYNTAVLVKAHAFVTFDRKQPFTRLRQHNSTLPVPVLNFAEAMRLLAAIARD